jgi:uncharacterized protein (DUF697 family)
LTSVGNASYLALLWRRASRVTVGRSRLLTPQMVSEKVHIVQTTTETPEMRDQLASQIVGRYSGFAAAAGVIPVPLIDVAAVGGLQLQMLRRLAEVYDVPFSENRGLSLLATLMGTIIPVSTAAPLSLGIASLLKGLPVVGLTLASLTMPALSASATYAIGHIFTQHFASGGTLLNFDPELYREFVKAQTEKHRAASTEAAATAAAVIEPSGTRAKGHAAPAT